GVDVAGCEDGSGEGDGDGVAVLVLVAQLGGAEQRGRGVAALQLFHAQTKSDGAKPKRGKRGARLTTILPGCLPRGGGGADGSVGCEGRRRPARACGRPRPSGTRPGGAG